MKKFSILTTVTLLGFLFSQANFADTPIKVGIIMPMEHQAMDEIVKGFETTLQKQYPHPIQFKVANAQNDPNLQRSIIMQMYNARFNLIVPIGEDTTQMTLAMVKDIPIVSLASDVDDHLRKNLHPCNVASVNDEVEDASILQFIHQAYPQIKHIVLFHSASDKIFPEVKRVTTESLALGIQIKPIMINTLPDLQSAANEIPDNTQAIFILKDSLMVSGVAQLAQIAHQKQIPLITSDDGSVESGAGFAVGVHESEIGVNGAHLALQILQGKNACNLPIATMTRLTVFVNPQAMQHSGQNMTTVLNTAKKLGLQTQIIQ